LFKTTSPTKTRIQTGKATDFTKRDPAKKRELTITKDFSACFGRISSGMRRKPSIRGANS
jgi:hypothetical protein